jgi:hypothetical protein
MTTRLPVLLENLRIATPCNADWDDMTGDDRVRFCGRCEKNVYNLSAMPRAEAEALVGAKEGRMCVRFYQRTDGTVLTADCPVGVRRQRLRARVWQAMASVTASAALLAGLITGRAARADVKVPDGGKKPAHGHTVAAGGLAPRQPEIMGKIAMPEPTPHKVTQPSTGILLPVQATPTTPQQPPVPMMGEPMPVMGAIPPPPRKEPPKKAEPKSQKSEPTARATMGRAAPMQGDVAVVVPPLPPSNVR